jgi:hypothetical protein
MCRYPADAENQAYLDDIKADRTRRWGYVLTCSLGKSLAPSALPTNAIFASPIGTSANSNMADCHYLIASSNWASAIISHGVGVKP